MLANRLEQVLGSIHFVKNLVPFGIKILLKFADDYSVCIGNAAFCFRVFVLQKNVQACSLNGTGAGMIQGQIDTKWDKSGTF